MGEECFRLPSTLKSPSEATIQCLVLTCKNKSPFSPLLTPRILLKEMLMLH